jgi:protein-histidine N-methyltransferase
VSHILPNVVSCPDLRAPDMSPLGAPHRPDDAPPPDPSEPGELPLPRALRAAFTQSLADASITLRFFAGGWSSFPVDAPYTLVLSSETIYETRSLPALIRLLRLAAGAAHDGKPGDAVSDSLSAATSRLRVSPRTKTLVAAKVLYFGVGGGVSDFTNAVEREHGRVGKVWENELGVGRQIMDIEW